MLKLFSIFSTVFLSMEHQYDNSLRLKAVLGNAYVVVTCEHYKCTGVDICDMEG